MLHRLARQAFIVVCDSIKKPSSGIVLPYSEGEEGGQMLTIAPFWWRIRMTARCALYYKMCHFFVQRNLGKGGTPRCIPRLWCIRHRAIMHQRTFGRSITIYTKLRYSQPMRPFTQSYGHDLPRLVDEFVPGVAAHGDDLIV